MYSTTSTLTCKTCGCKPGCDCGCHKPYRDNGQAKIISAKVVAETIGAKLEVAIRASNSIDAYTRAGGGIAKLELGRLFYRLHQAYHTEAETTVCDGDCPFAAVQKTLDEVE